jgi:hypothetical protein
VDKARSQTLENVHCGSRPQRARLPEATKRVEGCKPERIPAHGSAMGCVLARVRKGLKARYIPNAYLIDVSGLQPSISAPLPDPWRLTSGRQATMGWYASGLWPFETCEDIVAPEGQGRRHRNPSRFDYLKRFRCGTSGQSGKRTLVRSAFSDMTYTSPPGPQGRLIQAAMDNSASRSWHPRASSAVSKTPATTW